MFEDLKIICYPDPRLREKCRMVEAFGDSLKSLAARMFELMREQRGVGLAAPQVGQTIRMFVMNHTGKPEDDRLYVNPVLSDPDGDDEAEEGCLSLPSINIDVLRSKAIRIRAQDLDGKPFEQTESGYVARIWQHETDHLNGILLLNHMSPVQKLTWRKRLRELEAEYEATRKKKPVPSLL
ncbi:MAG: peptide deformylase [Tepidisphaerales bacterium]